jgi:hypothetical protein
VSATAALEFVEVETGLRDRREFHIPSRSRLGVRYRVTVGAMPNGAVWFEHHDDQDFSECPAWSWCWHRQLVADVIEDDGWAERRPAGLIHRGLRLVRT